MTSAVTLDPSAVALAKALGLVAADGSVDAAWFEHPLDHLRTIVDNPVQRRGLLDLLDSALPPSPAATALAPPGEQWHPVFEEGRYGVYLTVAGDVIGVAAAASTDPEPPGFGLVLRLPLVDASNGLTAVAGTAQGPLELSLSVSALGVDASAVASVDLEGEGSVRLVVREVDLGDGVPRTVALDPSRLGDEAVLLVVALVRTVLEELGADTGPIAEHLPGVLGLAVGLPLFPFDRIATDPGAFRGWMTAIAEDRTVLQRWFTHLAGLLGADGSTAPVPVSGEGTEAVPWRAPLLAVADGPTVQLTLARSQAGDRLLLGVGVELAGPHLNLEANATVAAVPLGGVTAVEVLPAAEVLLVATPGIPSSGAVSVGSIRAGLRWRGGQLQPGLALHEVTLEGHHYDVLDLSSTDAIVASAATALGDAISDALGSTGAGHALAALVGLVPPTADPTSPHRLSVADLAAAPTRAIAAFHVAVLADPDHPWSAVFAELTGVLGLDAAVAGTGSPDDPWRVPLADADAVTLHLAAWDEPVAGVAAGPTRHGLRIGLAATASPAFLDVGLRAGLLGFDLGDGPTPTWLVPGLSATVGAVPPAVVTDDGLRLDVSRAELRAGWRPGTPVRLNLALDAVHLSANGEQVGPLDLTIGTATVFDPTAPDLGLGLPSDLLGRVLGLLVAEVAASAGGPTAVVATGLLGLHRRLPGLPGDWPVLWPESGPTDLAALLRDPVTAVRDQLHRVATGTSSAGTPYALPALRWLRAAVDGRLGSVGMPSDDVLERLPPGWGTEEHPWRVPLPADPRVDLLLWTGETGPGPGWVDTSVRYVRAASTTADLLDRVRVAAEALPAVVGAITGRDPVRLAEALDSLDQWLAVGDGVVPLISQAAVGTSWTVADPVACAHGDLPADPDAVSAVVAQLDDWQPAPGRCVLLVSAPFEDHRVWNPLLASLDPGHAPDAHFHLRGPGVDPLQVDLTEVRAVCTTYTVDLADDPDPGVLVEQLRRVVERARTLTGAPRVVLVAHSASGIPVCAFAAAHDDLVDGVITLATPHAGGAFGALDRVVADDETDPGVELADAVRAASALAGREPTGLPLTSRTGTDTDTDTDTDTTVLRAVEFLAAALDAAPSGPLADGAAVFPVATFRAGAPAEVVVPGLALCAVAGRGPGGGAGLAAELADAVARALLATGTAAPSGTAAPPSAADRTGLALGLLVRPTLPGPGTGPDVLASVRVPLAEVPLAVGPAPARRRRLRAEALVGTADHWLLGAARPGGDPAEHRVRWARLGVEVAGGPGGITVTPIADLHDAWVGPPTTASSATTAGSGPASRPATAAMLSFPDAVDRLPLGEAPVPFGDQPGDGTAGALVVAALRDAGLLATSDDGLSPTALRDLASRPAAFLGPQAPELADLLLRALGFGGTSSGPWAIDLPQLGARLTVTRDPWTAVLAAAADPGDPQWQPGARLVGTLVLPTGAVTADAEVHAGPAVLRWEAAAGRLTADVGSWVNPVVLWPAPAQPGVPSDLAAAIGLLLGSGVVSAVGDALLPDGVRLRPLAGLIRDPLGFLRASGVLAGPDGTVDPVAVNGALATLAGLLGLDAAGPTGEPELGLPGGFSIRAVDGPVRLLLSGTLDLGGGDHLELGLGVGLAGAVAGSPVGEVGLSVSLPGDWGELGVLVGADPTGLSLVVTPAGGAAIRLLPQVDGLGALAGGAAALLPSVLQTLLDEARADGPPGQVLVVALDVAAALGIYGDDADGFRRADRSAELAAMLQPGWLETRTSTATEAVATLLVDLVAAAGLPFGTVDRVGALVRASIDVGVGTVRVSGGWSAPAAGPGAPTILVELDSVDLGPVLIESVLLGYDGDLRLALRLGLRPPELVTFLQPSLEVGVVVSPDDGRVGFAVDLLPFGDAARGEADITIAPVPAAVLTTDGALLLVERWGLPLVSLIALSAFGSDLATPLWAGGPSPTSVLTSAGLVVAGSDPPTLAAQPPPAAQMALRALAALAAGLTVPLEGMHIGLVTETAADGTTRYGVRLSGHQDLDADDVVVSLRFGETDWLADDPTAGVTAWVLEQPAQAALPALRPALELTGLGTVVSGKDGPLLDTYLRCHGVGVFFFAEVGFTDDTGAPAVGVEGLGLGGQLDGATLVISAADADSFVAKIIPSDIEADLDLAMSWRDGQGLRMYRAAAAGGLELTIPLDIDATILQITELWLRLRIGDGTAALAAALSGKGDLGPLHLVVTRVGVEARFGAGGGLAFRPPDGAGLSLDLSVVSGGGYLAHDERLYQYAGAVQLQFSAIALKALGIVTTRQPDGSPGFSLLIIISAEFTPIQLGFGFTLIGVGGLLGLNRTTDVPALRAGVREGTLGSILFPTDLVANAPTIVSDLNRVFPQAQGRFLVGPMAKIGWGTPALITVTLGVIIDLPSPIRLIILGRVQMVLPEESDAVVKLNLDVLGILDLGRKELSFDASLFDSHVAVFDITGDMALRASWGDNPVFALSAGGFHPRFSPPAGFPTLRRLAISLATGDNPRIRLEAYLALTSNTAQFGARLELYAEAAGFSIEGWLAFDALFQFDPFAFEVDISGGVALKRGQTVLIGISVELHLSGPRPWRARGCATAHILLFEVSVSFDVTVGRADPPPLPEPVDVAGLLETALDDPRSWAAQLPESAADTLFSLRAITVGDGELLVHPLGSLSFTQRVVPLSTTIERFGTARPKDAARFDVAVTLDARPTSVQKVIDEQFAPGQFFALGDDDRLNRPSFTALPAGQYLAGSTTERDRWLVRAAALDYEQKVVDAPDAAVPRTLRATGPGTALTVPGSPATGGRWVVRPRPPLRRLTLDHVDLATATSPAAGSAARHGGRDRFAGPSLGLAVSGPAGTDRTPEVRP